MFSVAFGPLILAKRMKLNRSKRNEMGIPVRKRRIIAITPITPKVGRSTSNGAEKISNNIPAITRIIMPKESIHRRLPKCIFLPSTILLNMSLISIKISIANPNGTMAAKGHIATFN